jgi:hypothetical protein
MVSLIDWSQNGTHTTLVYFALILTAMVLFIGTGGQVTAEPYRIGVYYWPGWRDQPFKPSPWAKIAPFPERKPLLGWYKEGEQAVMDQQLAWMKKFGLSFVVFSHLHDATGKAEFTHAVDAYMKSPQRRHLPFAMQWANHTPLPENEQQFYDTISFLIDNYFNKAEYLQIDRKPALFIWSGVWLEFNSRKFKGDVKAMLSRAQEMARERGLRGIYFIAGEAVPEVWVKRMNAQGYDAVSAYNYQNPPKVAERRYSHSYEELDLGYRENWNNVLNASDATYIVPMTVGWDRRPWGQTLNDPLHDNSFSTTAEFETHLIAARQFMDEHSEQTKGLGVICCWNEYGEGSFIEPTEAARFDRLETVQRAFCLQPKGTLAPSRGR